MGRAYHRKKIALGRGSKTRGTGVSYHLAVPPRSPELTPAEQAERAQTRTATAAKRGIREWNIHVLMHVAGFSLDTFEDGILRQRGVDRDESLERLIDRALTAVNTSVTRSCDSAGVDVDGLLRSLARPRPDALLHSALLHVRNRFDVIFAKAGA